MRYNAILTHSHPIANDPTTDGPTDLTRLNSESIRYHLGAEHYNHIKGPLGRSRSVSPPQLVSPTLLPTLTLLSSSCAMPVAIAPRSLTTDPRSLHNNAAPWWFNDSGLRKLALPILVGFASTISAGYDGSLMTGLQANPLFMNALGNPDGNKLGIIVGRAEEGD